MTADEEIDAEVERLLGPKVFSPQAISPDGKPYPYDLEPARARLRELLHREFARALS